MLLKTSKEHIVGTWLKTFMYIVLNKFNLSESVKCPGKGEKGLEPPPIGSGKLTLQCRVSLSSVSKKKN